jgi:hypothetical protein
VSLKSSARASVEGASTDRGHDAIRNEKSRRDFRSLFGSREGIPFTEESMRAVLCWGGEPGGKRTRPLEKCGTIDSITESPVSGHHDSRCKSKFDCVSGILNASCVAPGECDFEALLGHPHTFIPKLDLTPKMGRSSELFCQNMPVLPSHRPIVVQPVHVSKHCTQTKLNNDEHTPDRHRDVDGCRSRADEHNRQQCDAESPASDPNRPRPVPLSASAPSP